MKTLTVGDPSAWSAHNARYQPFFADFAQRFGFDDIMLLDTNGNVVYSAAKGSTRRQRAQRALPDHEARRRLPPGHALDLRGRCDPGRF